SVIERASDILDIATLADFFGNRWQVNALIMPTPVRDGNAYLQPVGEIMKLYRHHIGTYALDCTITGNDGAPVDVNASVSADGTTVYLHLVNTDRTESRRIMLDLPAKTEEITAFEIAHDSTEEITQMTPDLFHPVKRTVEGMTYILPAAAVAALEIRLA
ncbi:MAG: hypothetical protein IJP32_11090, partial [Clostridia bacterium]|nr:hypothetical protein [Clostridia bacterium]